MVWIERIALDIAAQLVSVQLFEPLWPTMTTRAKALERIQPKGMHVISVRHDVVNASSRSVDTISQTHLAQRLNK